MIASEIGADVMAAKMDSGLLHDIGEAVDHEVEVRTPRSAPRSPRSTSLPFKVVNGIAAHHQEVEYACLEAPIVQVADAISVSTRCPRRDDGDLRQAPRGPPGHRRELRRGGEVAGGPGGPRGPDPRPARRSTTCLPRASRATSSSGSRSSWPTRARSRSPSFARRAPSNTRSSSRLVGPWVRRYGSGSPGTRPPATGRSVARRHRCARTDLDRRRRASPSRCGPRTEEWRRSRAGGPEARTRARRRRSAEHPMRPRRGNPRV